MEIENFLLYARGALFLFAAAQMLLILVVTKKHPGVHWLVMCFLAALAVGGLASLAGLPDIGRFVNSYIVTALMMAMNVAMAVYLVYRRE